eukprot:361443-Chlamydomonas_euryale.AAC.4
MVARLQAWRGDPSRLSVTAKPGLNQARKRTVDVMVGPERRDVEARHSRPLVGRRPWYQLSLLIAEPESYVAVQQHGLSVATTVPFIKHFLHWNGIPDRFCACLAFLTDLAFLCRGLITFETGMACVQPTLHTETRLGFWQYESRGWLQGCTRPTCVAPAVRT